MSSNNEHEMLHDDALREHTYDGIQEYDKRLPNWWLWTLYGAIMITVVYWFNYHLWGTKETQIDRFNREMAAHMAKLANAGGDLSDEQLWEMSQSDMVIAKGQTIFMETCATCHGKDLKGGIGVNLADAEWLHGGNPNDLIKTVRGGILAKGMPNWEPVLGRAKINDVVAFVLSYHQKP